MYTCKHVYSPFPNPQSPIPNPQSSILNAQLCILTQNWMFCLIVIYYALLCWNSLGVGYSRLYNPGI